jgi:DNA-binding CsgD family transcriptional regulator
VLGIDNLHHLDPASLRALAWIFSRLQNSSLTVVMTERPGRRPVGSRPRSELLQHIPVRYLELAPLSPEGVRAVVADRLGDAEADRHAARYAELCDGSPLVLRHLIHVHTAGMQDHPAQYGFAVLSVLLRGEPCLLTVARALAVLGADASPEAVAAVAGVSGELAQHALYMLRGIGVLYGMEFRDPSVAVELLDDLPRRDRAALRRRAAAFLHEAGAPAGALAVQLVETPLADLPWAEDALAGAAREALTHDQPRTALAFLEHALRAPHGDPGRRAGWRARISRLKWQLSPATAAQELPALGSGLAAGHLGPGDVADLCWLLAWYGELEMLGAILEEPGRPGRTRRSDADVLQAVRTWLDSMYPGLVDTAAGGIAAPVPDRPAGRRLDPWSSAAELADALVRQGGGALSARAEEYLYARPDHDSLWSGELALLTMFCLIYADELDAAADWCAHLLSEARRRGTPAWTAVFTAAAAEIDLRRGDLDAATRGAQEALTALPPSGWGVAIGLPISTLVLASVREGRLDQASAHLARPAPEAMFRSRYGLHYLYARGHYRLASGDPRLALADFLLCGKLTGAWTDRGTGPVLWRVAAARAWMGLGDRDQARLLAREELARIAPGSARARGLALHVLADLCAPAERPLVLTEAAAALDECGDRFEQTRILVALCHAYRDIGDHVRARRAARRAVRRAGLEAEPAESASVHTYMAQNHLALPEAVELKRAQMEPVQSRIGQADADHSAVAHRDPDKSGLPKEHADHADRADHADQEQPAQPDPALAPAGPVKARGGGRRSAGHSASGIASLTARERDVAALASQGLTNQEIAGKLLITPSTVEQHLTRVFRKLRVSGRSQLPGEPLSVAVREASAPYAGSSGGSPCRSAGSP